MIEILFIFILLIFSSCNYVRFKKIIIDYEKRREEQKKMQNCLLYILNKQELLIENEIKNISKKEILDLNHCAEVICIQLSSNKFTCQQLPFSIAEDYLKKNERL